jgi:hypothetical protein
LKIHKTIRSLGVTNSKEGFDYLIETLRPSLKLWNYFVNWDKVFENTRALEIHLNLWNYLLGKQEFDTELDALLTQHPEIVAAIPALLVRDGKKTSVFEIIEDIGNISAPDAIFDFSKPADTLEARQNALVFMKRSGLERLFRKGGVKNLVDYVLGVEAGLDSNGRKNRAGSSMEAVVEAYLASFSQQNGTEFIVQATAAAIKNKWGFNVPVDKSERRFDFAISDGATLTIMEVNFYGGGGSKLKSTAGEYIGLSEMLKASGFGFVWVTDGEGWKSTLLPLKAAYEKIDNVWNLDLLTKGCLNDVI